jgi:tRNA pseudouridine55 synthase
MTQSTPNFGLLNIDKPSGVTSHDVVAIVRRATKIKKIGHAGTLDPLATGVLVLCLGKATRLSAYAMSHTKVYEAQIHLGVETETYDAEGQITTTNSASISQAEFEAVLTQFLGDIDQLPPMYSAIKKGGKKLYELARKGETIEVEPRPVTIESLTIQHWEFPYVDLEIICSPGTYIRSFAHDIGQLLGVGGHLSALRRTASGNFRVENAVSLDTLRTAIERDEWQQYLLSPDLAIVDMPSVNLTQEQSDIIRQGGFIELVGDTTEQIGAFDPAGQLVAIMALRQYPNIWKPVKVFH